MSLIYPIMNQLTLCIYSMTEMATVHHETSFSAITTDKRFLIPETGNKTFANVSTLPGFIDVFFDAIKHVV